MKIGKTIGGEREKAISESERLQVRKKAEKKKKFSIIVFFVILIFVFVVVAGIVVTALHERKKNESVPASTGKKYVPSITIEDESGTGYITDKIKDFVGMLESDFKDLGYKVTRAIVPVGKTREVDIYLDGRNEYFKCQIDRNTAETAEDAVRMMNYLDKNGKSASYVDIRISGRAYYK